MSEKEEKALQEKELEEKELGNMTFKRGEMKVALHIWAKLSEYWPRLAVVYNK